MSKIELNRVQNWALSRDQNWANFGLKLNLVQNWAHFVQRLISEDPQRALFCRAINKQLVRATCELLVSFLCEHDWWVPEHILQLHVTSLINSDQIWWSTNMTWTGLNRCVMSSVVVKSHICSDVIRLLKSDLIQPLATRVRAFAFHLMNGGPI